MIGLPAHADARGYRIDQMPAGHVFECYACHFRQPFTRLTVFGIDTRRGLLFADDYAGQPLPENFFIGDEGNVDWAALALIDSDGDGYTNGEELGDPMGLYIQFDLDPDFPFTRPDLPEDFPCGSGTIEGPEACDGEALGELSCADFGFPGGVLRCADDCQPDTSGCNQCGDGVIDPDEACDGAAPPGEVCGPDEVGMVGCALDCTIDRSDCRPAPDAALPDAALPDAALPDAALPDAALPDATLPDAALLDGMTSDGAAADRGSPDVDPIGPRLDAAGHLDAMLDEPGADRGPRRTAPTADGGCRLGAAPTHAPWALLWLAVVVIGQRWRCRSRRDS